MLDFLNAPVQMKSHPTLPPPFIPTPLFLSLYELYNAFQWSKGGGEGRDPPEGSILPVINTASIVSIDCVALLGTSSSSWSHSPASQLLILFLLIAFLLGWWPFLIPFVTPSTAFHR